MTRTFFALAVKCGGRGAWGCTGDHWGRIGGLTAPRSFCSASSDTSAMPLSPVPPKRRKSRRLSSQRPAFERGPRSKRIHKLIGIEQSTAKERQPLFPRQSDPRRQLTSLGRPLKRQLKRAADLRGNVTAHLLLQ